MQAACANSLLGKRTQLVRSIAFGSAATSNRLRIVRHPDELARRLLQVFVCRRSRSASPLFILTSIVVAIAALYFAKEILLPFALAVLLSFLLTPLANRLERLKLGPLGLGRVPSVLLVVAMTFVVLGGVGWVVTSQLVELAANCRNTKITSSKRPALSSPAPARSLRCPK